MPPCTTCHSHHDILATSDDLLGTGERGTCSACHEDRCDKATLAMKQDLGRLTSATAQAQADLARADRLGMDVERPTYELAGAADALVRARVQVHSFSQESFRKVIAEGLEIAAEVDKAAKLVLFAGLLALKARRIENSRRDGGA